MHSCKMGSPISHSVIVIYLYMSRRQIGLYLLNEHSFFFPLIAELNHFHGIFRSHFQFLLYLFVIGRPAVFAIIFYFTLGFSSVSSVSTVQKEVSLSICSSSGICRFLLRLPLFHVLNRTWAHIWKHNSCDSFINMRCMRILYITVGDLFLSWHFDLFFFAHPFGRLLVSTFHH